MSSCKSKSQSFGLCRDSLCKVEMKVKLIDMSQSKIDLSHVCILDASGLLARLKLIVKSALSFSCASSEEQQLKENLSFSE